MRILLTPNLPRSVRALAHELAPAGCTLEIMAASHPGYADAVASAECLIGLPRNRFDDAFFARAPQLRLVQLMRAGHELIDLAAAARANVQVATVGATTSAIVAEHCLMLMLALGRKLRWQHEAVTGGGWLVAKPWQLPSGDVDSVPRSFDGLGGRTLGILGLGEIGTRRAAGERIRHDGAGARPRRRAGARWHSAGPVGDLLETSDVGSTSGCRTRPPGS
ncbi:MAG: hypothetical protein WKG01_29760 [Kofleriaceae bacterium]